MRIAGCVLPIGNKRGKTGKSQFQSGRGKLRKDKVGGGGRKRNPVEKKTLEEKPWVG